MRIPFQRTSTCALCAILIFAEGLPAASRPPERLQLRLPRHGAWQVEAPPDRGGAPDVLVLPKVRAVSRFWKCVGKERLVAEVACFDDWPDWDPDPWFNQPAFRGGYDPEIEPERSPLHAAWPVNRRHDRNKDICFMLLEMTQERRYVPVEERTTVFGASRRWGVVGRDSGIFLTLGKVHWDIGVEAAILPDGSEVTLVFRIRAEGPRRKTRAQVEEILDSLRVVKSL